MPLTSRALRAPRHGPHRFPVNGEGISERVPRRKSPHHRFACGPPPHGVVSYKKEEIEMKVIADWRKALWAYSTWALGAVVALPALWSQVPEEVRVLIPDEQMKIVLAVVAAAGLVGRFVDQKVR